MIGIFLIFENLARLLYVVGKDPVEAFGDRVEEGCMVRVNWKGGGRSHGVKKSELRLESILLFQSQTNGCVHWHDKKNDKNRQQRGRSSHGNDDSDNQRGEFERSEEQRDWQSFC
jgi:hypothetical protein